MDLTKIDKPFGELDRETKLALFTAWVDGARIENQFGAVTNPVWNRGYTYRVAPTKPSIEALELALTQSRAETAAAVEMLNDADHQYNRLTNDMIARHAAEQAKSRAETAAAYERAAKAVTDAPVFSDNDTDGQSAAKVIALGRAAKAIRALATPDQSAALDRLIAEAVGPYVEALAWYGEQSRLARLIHSEGDTGRNALQADGGKRAKAILAAIKGAKA